MITNLMTGEIEMTTQEAAEYIGCSVGSLNNDRNQKRRIPYLKVMGKVRYKLSDLEALKQYHGGQA